MENDADLVEKLKALLAAERELREALEGFDDDLDADVPDSLEALDAALAKVLRSERWSGLLRELRRPDRPLMAGGADPSQYFERR